jgi:serine/threonine protein kinase/formylglycine-generating enzyme required for sulfatase activity
MDNPSFKNPAYESLTNQQLSEIDALGDRFDQELLKGNAPRIENFLTEAPEAVRDQLVAELLAMELEYRHQHGEPVQLENYLQRFPQQQVQIATVFDNLAKRTTPQRIGRYRIEKVLGQGGFGIVYLGHDEQLNRRVAVKVPHAKLIAKPEDAKAYLAEARMVANLDHPGIVPVHDVGSAENCPCYIVTKYIPGTDLATKIKQRRLKCRAAAEIVASVAESLHYAHTQGLVHRDVKPGNILMGEDDKPYVVDFGLALREENVGKGPKYAGTPAYMSPEQARGEGHRVDGRSDIFSLGIVFYELLAGRKPFRGDTVAELMEQVTSYEARPLRQYDEKLPKELERICHKAMAKRANDRYSSAHDMAEDLRHFLAEQTVIQCGASPGGISLLASETPTSHNASTSVGSTAASSDSLGTGSLDNLPIKIVPKGLRSFDAQDADFFLELLPGPRDREGLPDSLRFWKTRVEETDPDNTFKVGLIYGPSGCGKSSLVKAGLLPRLSDDVIAVYVEATPEETEARLLHGLRKRCSGLKDSLTLKETLADLRRGQGIPVGRKVLIVLDQFEQWLHSKKEEENTELVQALRQCDGGRVQCIVMVRDDFWLAATRFMGALEFELLQGQNTALADLFDLDHARKVLGAFGRAFRRLPENINDSTREQKDFLKQSVAGLSEHGKVVCVRLALFAEMMKGKEWSPAVLKEVGGTKGVGVTFLEETFSAQTAHPKHRLHQSAARAVLRALLPKSGTDIKGEMKSHDELLEVSGYANRPKDFADLLRILDSEIRLITPTDPEGKDPDDDSPTQAQAGQKYFQLTHDYLVHSLRDWLTRKQRETRQGRAELKLAERSALWNAKPENRYLPSLTEWFSIGTLTNSKHWSVSQRGMMQRATRIHSLRSGVAVASLMAIVFLGVVARGQVLRQQEATRIEGLVGTLLRAEPAQVPVIVKELESNPAVAAALLSPLVLMDAKTDDERRSLLHARLGMVARDKSLVEPLLEELLTSKAVYIGPIREQLRPYAGELTQRLRAILRDNEVDANRRFRAATALADFVPESESALWTDSDLQFVAGKLVLENSEFQPLLRELLRSISKKLLPELETIFGDTKSTDAQRLSAANAFADFAASDIAKLSHLLLVSNPEQYAILYPSVAAAPAPSTVEDLGKIAATLPPSELGSLERISYGQRRANSAVTLLRLGEREKVLPVFEMTDDPEALTQFIFRCRDRGVRVEELLDCWRMVCESPVDHYPRNARYALLLTLGGYTLSEIPEARRDTLVKQLTETYRNDPSSGVHGAAGWLLRQWGQDDVVQQVDQTPVPYSADREWFTLAITVMPTAPPQAREPSVGEKGDQESKADPPAEGNGTKNTEAEHANSELLPQKTFYYTFIVFPAVESEIGSVSDEPYRSKRESEELRHRVTLTRPFALLDREITMEELIAFDPDYASYMIRFGANPLDAGVGADWYDSVSFCRWLGQQSGMSEADQSYSDPESLGQEEYPREPSPAANWAPRNWPLQVGKPGFRLPTESEWEVANRSGVRAAYGFGSDLGVLDRFGWFQAQIHPPQKLRPSLRGLFDMHGNVYEWTHDWYSSYPETSVVDPLVSEGDGVWGEEGGGARVLRGGSSGLGAAYGRTAYRRRVAPTTRANDCGFRVALGLPVKSPTADNKDK